MRRLTTLLMLAPIIAAPAVFSTARADQPRAADVPVTRIAFGSCYKEDGDDRIWTPINAWRPDLFVFLGDNIYADTDDMAVMRRKYATLGALPGFAELRARSTVLATWDDHDFGVNDAGAEYPMKRQSQKEFLDFWGEPAATERRATPGVYDAELLGPPGRRVQIILLDTRYFRDTLDKLPERDRDFADGRAGNYAPTADTSRTILGEAQWRWLEQQLRIPADLRIIASSIQFVAEEHAWEMWATMPHERERMLDLIESTNAERVVFISGDRHKAELSRLAPDDADLSLRYPIYDFTSSAMNRPTRWYNEINRHRIGSDYPGANFGSIEIDWDSRSLTMRLHDDAGAELIRHRVDLDELR